MRGKAAPRRSNLQRRAPDYESRRFLATRNTTKSAMKAAMVAKKMVISHLLTSMIVGQVFVRIRVRHRSPSVQNRCSPRRRPDRPAARAELQRRAVRLAIPTQSGTTGRGGKWWSLRGSHSLRPWRPNAPPWQQCETGPSGNWSPARTSPKAAPEDLPPRSWVASAPTCSSGPVVQTTRCAQSLYPCLFIA